MSTTMSHAKPIATLRTAAGLPTGRLALWWLLASEVVIFGGLLASYVMQRIGHPSGPTRPSTPTCGSAPATPSSS